MKRAAIVTAMALAYTLASCVGLALAAFVGITLITLGIIL